MVALLAGCCLTDTVNEKKLCTNIKQRTVTVGCGRRTKVFRQQPVRRLRSFAAGNQLIDTDYWKRCFAYLLTC